MLTFLSCESEWKWLKAILKKNHSQTIENDVGSIVSTKSTETQKISSKFRSLFLKDPNPAVDLPLQL